MNETIKLSTCIIAKNEEKMLPGCIESILQCSDEIILVDTGSNDKTIDIAKNYGCKIIESQWQNDFSQARNMALEPAQYPYILVIDADERLSNPELVKVILGARDSKRQRRDSGPRCRCGQVAGWRARAAQFAHPWPRSSAPSTPTCYCVLGSQ